MSGGNTIRSELDCAEAVVAVFERCDLATSENPLNCIDNGDQK